MAGSDDDLPENDDDLPEMDDDDLESASAVDEEWQKIVSTTFGDSSAMHQFQTILDMA
jgi:hypothetical protein